MRDMRIHALVAAIFLFFVTSGTAASAQLVQCGNRAAIVSGLASKHKEQQAAIGVAKDGRLLEIWVNPKSGTFTVLLTFANMNTCIVAAGDGYESRRIGEFVRRFEY